MGWSLLPLEAAEHASHGLPVPGSGFGGESGRHSRIDCQELHKKMLPSFEAARLATP